MKPSTATAERAARAIAKKTETIEGAVAFYNGDAFNNSPSGRVLASTDPNGVRIRLDAMQVVAVAAFLRVVNALENIRESIALLDSAAHKGLFERDEIKRLLGRAVEETGDGIRVELPQRLRIDEKQARRMLDPDH